VVEDGFGPGARGLIAHAGYLPPASELLAPHRSGFAAARIGQGGVGRT
jgi:hypothetical protein